MEIATDITFKVLKTELLKSVCRLSAEEIAEQ